MSDAIAQYWDDRAAGYDDEPDHGLGRADTRAAWQSLLSAWLPPRPSRVADLACGTGSLSALVAQLGHDVLAVDLAPNMVRRARAKCAPFGERVRIVHGDVSDPPLDRASVDVVLARHILWTLPDPHEALARWVRAVRPGGRLVLVEGRWWSPQDQDPDQQDPDQQDRMPWAGGVRADDLQAALEPLVASSRVVRLSDPVLWGKQIRDERYLLVADVGERVR